MRAIFPLTTALFLSACLAASGAVKKSASPEVPSAGTQSRTEASSARLYANALRIISLANDSHFLVVPSNAYAAEPHAMLGYTVDAKTHAVLRSFNLSSGLGPGVAREGTVGQIFGAALSHDRTLLACSGSYLDANGAVKSAIVIRRATAHGDWRPVQVIHEITGAGDLAFTSDGGLLAVEFDPHRSADGAPLLVRFDANGRRTKELFAQEPGLSPVNGAQRSVRGRLQALGDDRFAFHDGVSARVEIFRVDGDDISELRRIDAAVLKNDEAIDRVRGWRLDAEGGLTVVRLPPATPKAPRVYRLVTIAADGHVLREDEVAPSFTKVFWENDALWGVNGDAAELSLNYLSPADR
ncbi:MAG TPA: hypothetical protein VHW00_02875 [Thermoanaerobaculia bacterium]|nr:hypothetical protein [Thermoanaerobaculia bacterium]